MKSVDIDLFTGYRYYLDEQLEDINVILKLKEASFSLEEIKEYWNNFDDNIMLNKKKELLNQKVEINHKKEKKCKKISFKIILVSRLK